MNASSLSKAKRPHSPPSKDTPIRRVRQRVGSSSSVLMDASPSKAHIATSSSQTKKREESPEEGEVEEDDLPPAPATQPADALAASNTNGTVEPNQDELNKDKLGATAEKKKVAFPFKSRAAKVQAIPTVDMENGPAPRPIPPTISPSKGDSARGGGLGGSQNGTGRDTYVPPYSRGGRDTYVPSRDRDRDGARGRDRSWSPPHRDDDRKARSKSPVEAWDTYIAPKYQDPEGRMRGGRLMDTYVAPPERDSDRPSWGRSSPPPHRGSGAGDTYRPYAHTPPPPRDRSPFSRHSPPGPTPHRLPPRPPSPDRYFPPRHEERHWENSSRDHEWDRGRYVGSSARSPRPSSFEPPSVPGDSTEAGSQGMDASSSRSRVSFSRQGDGAAVLLQQQQQQSLSQPLPPRPSVPLGAKDDNRSASGPGRTHPGPPHNAHSGPNEPEKPKASKHKVAQVRTKDEERTAYGREFVGSGRINEYMVLNKLGEGTFGEVHRARRCDAPEGSQYVALKRIIMHSEKDGMPITALREIKILKALNHPNIVKVLDIVVQPRTPNAAGSVYMVFPYMDHDLAGLLDNKAVQLAQSHIKLYMKQLLEGLEYMHENHIIHRDIKAANILISNEGVLQIADFGLARAYTKKSKKERLQEASKRGKTEKYTNCVVTRWYRPPELLMGERLYGPEIDIWGVGCILAEMFVRKPVFQGQSDLDQLDKIWWLCGTPTKETWPDFETLPGLDGVKEFKPRPKGLNDFLRRYDSITREAYDLIDALLSLDPTKRPTASTALLHDYFWTTPLPADPKTLPKYEASHELDRRRKEALPPPAPPPNAHQHSYQFSHGHGGGGQFNHRGRGRGGGGGYQQRNFHPGMPGPPPPGMGPLPPGLPMHPGMHALPPPPHHGEAHFNQQQGPPAPGSAPGLPPPRGFRPPPPPRGSYSGQQPPYPGNFAGRPPGPNQAPPPQRDQRGPPPPPNDSVVLHYG